MSKRAAAASKKRQLEEDKLKQAVKDHPYKPSKMAELGKFYLDLSVGESGDAAKQLKRKAYDTYIETIAKYDQLKFTRDNNGAPIKLDKKEINQKCNLLNRLAMMSKDLDIIMTPSEDAENDDEIIENPKLQSEANQVYYLLRTELAYREEGNDIGMANRYKQDVDSLQRIISKEAYDEGKTNFVNFLEDEEAGITGNGATPVKNGHG